MFEDIFKNVQSGLFNFTVLDSFYFLPILKHTEGYSSNSYKDFLMPLIFPTGSDSKTARVIDFSNFYNNIKKITENSNTSNDYLVNNYNLGFKKQKYGNHSKFYNFKPEDRSYFGTTKSKKNNYNR